LKNEQVVDPKCGTAFELQKGIFLKIIDLEGRQVVDLLAFNMHKPREHLSTGATIDCNGSLVPRKGDFLYSNRYNPLLQLIEDTVGVHDLLHPPCSREMYRCLYNITGSRPNCHDNFLQSIKKFGLDETYITTPFNVFMHSQITAGGKVTVKEPLSRAGDYILLKAEMDLLVAITACSVEESACNAYKCSAIKVELNGRAGQ